MELFLERPIDRSFVSPLCSQVSRCALRCVYNLPSFLKDSCTARAAREQSLAFREVIKLSCRGDPDQRWKFQAVRTSLTHFRDGKHVGTRRMPRSDQQMCSDGVALFRVRSHRSLRLLCLSHPHCCHRHPFSRHSLLEQQRSKILFSSIPTVRPVRRLPLDIVVRRSSEKPSPSITILSVACIFLFFSGLCGTESASLGKNRSLRVEKGNGRE